MTDPRNTGFVFVSEQAHQHRCKRGKGILAGIGWEHGPHGSVRLHRDQKSIGGHRAFGLHRLAIVGQKIKTEIKLRGFLTFSGVWERNRNGRHAHNFFLGEIE
jgi:hypothetical protein